MRPAGRTISRPSCVLDPQVARVRYPASAQASDDTVHGPTAISSCSSRDISSCSSRGRYNRTANVAAH